MKIKILLIIISLLILCGCATLIRGRGVPIDEEGIIILEQAE